MTQVALTFDVDWADDEVLLDSLDLVRNAGVKATFFATHATELLAKVDRRMIEIGIHPNFNPLLDGKGEGSFRDVFKTFAAMYPDVVGFRSHGVVSSGPIMYHAPEYGMLYESNMYIPRPSPCFRDYDGVIRIPMYWSDYRELLVGTPYNAGTIELPQDVPAVMAFHPAHVFINSESPERPKRTRNLSTAEKRAQRHTGTPAGARDFLIGLLARIAREKIETVTLREVAEAYVEKHGTTVAIHATRHE
jgi:hypothetical protein